MDPGFYIIAYVEFAELNRVFRKLTTLTIMAILTSKALLREKESSDKMLPQWD